MNYRIDRPEKHLRVFETRSEYHLGNGNVEVYEEGVISNAAKKRSKEIKDAFESGFLDSLIMALKESKIEIDLSKVNLETQHHLRRLVELVTSEVGRALIGLTIMQLSIKAISPEQCIRLHKASSNKGSFSWVEGVSMRTLDKNYVTPILRRHGLVRLNADGFMMTRSLAENYPYSSLYKAQLRGAREDWLSIVEKLETGATHPLESLKYLIVLLLNSANVFAAVVAETISTLGLHIAKFDSMRNAIALMNRHVEISDYAARLLEVSMHSLLQAAVDSGALGDLVLRPLSQMRSANKKHGNIGDIELLEGRDIVESWDAKYGKSYLREEVEEASEKIVNHNHVQLVGFVTNVSIQRSEELDNRIKDLAQLHGVDFRIVEYAEWVTMIFARCTESGLITETELSRSWIEAYVLTLAQKKRDIAPIDEPCMEWVRLLKTEIERA